MVDLRAELEEACAEHDRLVLAEHGARERQEGVVTRYLDGVASELRTADLGFAVEGIRAHGLTLPRPGAAPIFLVVSDGGWQLVARHAHGIHAVVDRMSVGSLLDAFGRSTFDVLERAAANVRTVPPAAALPSPSTRPATSPPSPAARTRACPNCEAQPNLANYARHLRGVHGVGPEDRTRRKTPAHQICRLCNARLPAGRLDPHMTAAHGIFHVHPAGNASEARRAAIQTTRRDGRSRAMPCGASTEPAPPSSLVHASSSGRDFLDEARHERRLVARADSPLRNRERNGRFVDAPDVERMDGESEA